MNINKRGRKPNGKFNSHTTILNAFFRHGSLTREELEDIIGYKSIPARIHELKESFPGLTFTHRYGRYSVAINRNLKIKKAS